MKPLAYVMRPKHYDDVVGHENLVGENGVLRKMIEKRKWFSFILYGSPGTGKTTIAEATCHMSGLAWFKFNASTDNKDALKQIINEARFGSETIVIIDEIHRMKKDIQDFLLPYVENGTIIMIGLTTVNPYHSVNPAIRSRTMIYKLQDLTPDNLHAIIDRALRQSDNYWTLDDEVYDYLIKLSGNEIRTLINNYECLTNTVDAKHITLEMAKAALLSPSITTDANQDTYYDTLSGLHKSIRGSDVDASLHYLAMLLVEDDLQSLCRRLLCVAYEDIGLANPTIGPRVKAACDAARELGMPEARLPLAVIVIEMALSPKSNSALLAIEKALEDVQNGQGGNLPLHLKNLYSFDPKQTAYKYPHAYPNAWVKQQYLPDNLKDVKYYEPKESSNIEKGLKSRYDEIEKWKKMN